MSSMSKYILAKCNNWTWNRAGRYIINSRFLGCNFIRPPPSHPEGEKKSGLKRAFTITRATEIFSV